MLSYQRAHNPLRLCAALLLLGLLAATPTVAPAARAAAPSEGYDIPCDASPFGHVLNLGQKNEVFLGLKHMASDFPGSLYAYRLGTSADNGPLMTQYISDPTVEAANITALAGTAADLDGDGKAEFVQGYTDASGAYQVLVRKNGSAAQLHTESWPGHSNRAMAAGDVLALDNGSQQVVVASRAADGGLSVAVFGGAPGGGVGGPLAVWRSNTNNRSGATRVHVAVGNLDNDGYADIVVSLLQSDNRTAQLIYLEYQPSYQAGSGPNYAQNLQERATTTYSVGGSGGSGPKDVQLALANLSGSAQDRVVLAWDQGGYSGGLSPLLSLRNFDYGPVNGFVAREQATISSNSLSFALAAGDVLGARRDQIVLEYDTEGNSSFGHLNIDTIALDGVNTPNPTLSTVNHWEDAQNYRAQTSYLALAVGDFNRDNRAEVVSAFKDANANGFQTIYLHEKFGQGGQPTGLQIVDWGRQDSTISAAPTIALGDWNNDSLRATVGGKCARVVDGNITAVGFVPPYWQNIQGGQQKGGSIGRSVSQEGSVETSLTYSRSQTVSAYIGASVGASFFDLVEFSASAKATGAQEYATSNKRTTSVSTSTVTTVGQSWLDDALVYDPAEYNCYSYQLSENGAPISADVARLRFCEYQALPGNVPPLKASELNSWDTNFGAQPEYAPAVRDWSSLALFRGAFADQSSNADTAKLAVDSEIANGSFVGTTTATTNNENHAWWQVDLGVSQPIGKIRLWAPPGGLANFYVLVSDSDFRTMPNQDDPNVLAAQPGVQHYTLADLGNGFAANGTAPAETTFLTLDAQHKPIKGRYVRVQLAGTGALALSEVQAFGPNHVEPDRYPLDLRPGAPNSGFFEVKLFNPFHTSDADTYAWVKTRGSLLWDGRKNDPLNALSVDRGNTITDWSLNKGNVATKVEAEEIATNTSVGAEFDIEGGVGVKVQTGGGVERTTGVASETALSTSWGTEFNMGGQMQGFPPAYDGQENSWVLSCRYRFQPYYYEVSDASSLGYQHRFPVLDYLVPAQGRDLDLNRARDLAACRNGNLPSQTPRASNDTAQTAPGQPVTLNVLANDQGNSLRITDAGPAEHGTVAHDDRTITYTPNVGFVGTERFTYTLSDGATMLAAAPNSAASGTVTISVGSGGAATTVYLPLVQR